MREHVRAHQEVLNHIPGFQGLAAYKGVQDVYARLVLYAYESPEAMAQGTAAVADMPILSERVGDTTAPIDVMRLKVECSDGAFANGIPADAMISASVHVAEPGYGPDAADDFENEFGGLTMVDGYAGMAIGSRENMADEIVGFTAWRTAEGLAASMPQIGTVEVTLYEPLGEA